MDLRPVRTMLARISLILTAAAMLGGCSFEQGAYLDPGGLIGRDQRNLFYFAGIIMSFVLLAVYILLIVVLWRYRASNPRGAYTPKRNFSTIVEFCVWSGPAIIICIIGAEVVIQTHRLDPYRPVASSKPLLHIQAIALNWKWLFIYPDQGGLVTVNEVAFPVDTPVEFVLTSDVAMNSFMVQGLAGQIFAMAGMQTRMNMIANRPGSYLGRNMQFSGDGFSKQNFVAKALSDAEYAQWLSAAKSAPKTFDQKAYDEVAKESESYPVTFFSSGGEGVFDRIVAKYMPADAASSASAAAAAPAHRH